MSQLPVEILVIADRSGSMSSLANEAIGGFNRFLAEQKAAPGKATVSLVLFDDQYETPYVNVDIQHVAPLTSETFVPRGMTALYDAAGRALQALLARAPERAIVMIITDGAENASREFSHGRVQELISQAKAKRYEVLFLASGINAVAVGSSLGVVNNFQHDASPEGLTRAYATMNASTLSYRAESSETKGG